MLSLLGVYLVTKMYQSSTWELWCSFLFQYSKLTFIFVFFMIDKRMSIYYALLCFILWLTLSHPKYTGYSKIIVAQSKDHIEKVIGKSMDELIKAAQRQQKATTNQKG